MTEQFVNVENAAVHQEQPAGDDGLVKLGKEILARVEKGEKAQNKSDEMFISAGKYLIEAKGRVTNFPKFLADCCVGLHKTRAYELIKIAKGKITPKEVRAKTNERKKRHRAKSATVVRSGTDTKSAPAVKAIPKHTASENALAQFRVAVDTWISKMDAATKQKALAYVTEKCGLKA
jgi:hypothetical protein